MLTCVSIGQGKERSYRRSNWSSSPLMLLFVFFGVFILGFILGFSIWVLDLGVLFWDFDFEGFDSGFSLGLLCFELFCVGFLGSIFEFEMICGQPMQGN